MAITVVVPPVDEVLADATAPSLTLGVPVPEGGGATADAIAPQVWVTGPNGYAYVYANVGAIQIDQEHPEAVEYVHANLGVEWPPPDDNGYVYTYINVGIEEQTNDDGYVYVYSNVNTDQPLPHIWFLRPTSGREGDGFSIYGHGFGQTNDQYNGHAYLGAQSGWDGEEAIDAAFQLSETAWQQVDAGPDAYTAAREIHPLIGEPDMEHQRIDVTVYDGAESGTVRVQTDDV